MIIWNARFFLITKKQHQKYMSTKINVHSMDHCSHLSLFCRVYGSRIMKAKAAKNVCRKYSCKELKSELKTAFDIEITNDQPDVVPAHMCRHCYAVMHQCINAYKKKRHIDTQ